MSSQTKKVKIRKIHAGTGLVALVFLFLIVMTLPSVAQLPTGTVLGTVRDSTGAVVPSATVTVRNTETGLTRTAQSSADGSYRFAALPVGTYEIRAEQAGFRTEVRSGMSLAVGQEAVVNFALQVGAIEQTVEVTGEAPLVNTTSGSLGGLVDERQVSDLPLNGRNYINLTLLQPGIVQHDTQSQTGRGAGIWFSANGAPPRSNFYMLDGTPIGNTDGATSASVAGSTLGVEGIREWRMLTNSYSAEYGMRVGAQMSIVSKGGTNEFHGSLFEYLRNSALDARNFFDYKTETTPRRVRAFTRNQFGGSAGGPLQHDKVFFFGTYEGLRERLGVTSLINVIPAQCLVSTNNPCAVGAGNPEGNVLPAVVPILGLYPTPNLPSLTPGRPQDRFTFPSTDSTGVNYGQARGDYNFSTNDTAFVRYTIDRGDKTQPLDYPQFRRIGVTRNQFLTGAETHTFSPVLLGTFRFSLVRQMFDLDSVSGLSGPQYSLAPGLEIGRLSVGGLTVFGPDNAAPSFQHTNAYSWSGDLFHTRGRHSFKFGTLINYYRQLLDASVNARGTVTFADVPAFLLGQTTSYLARKLGSETRRDYHYTTLGFYLQDDFRAFSNLTLNLGLRYEFHTDHTEVSGRGSALRDVQRDATFTPGLPFENPSLRNISPRFGFAWDVRGDGSTAVRGGFALLYNVAGFAQWLQNLSAASPPFSSHSSVTTPGTFAVPLFFPPSSVGGAVRTADYHMRNPHMLHYNLAVERQLPANMSVSVASAGSRGDNLQNNNEGNPTQQQVVDDHFFWPLGVRRISPYWTQIAYYTADRNSWYNSLQFVVNKRFSRGVQFQSSYTWGQLLDEGGGVTVNDGGGGRATTSMPRSMDRGLANWNLAHTWRFNAIYRLPPMPFQGFLDKLLNGWWMSGILSAQTGLPFTPSLASNTRTRSQGPSAPELNAGRRNENIVEGVAGSCAGARAGLPLGGSEIYFDPCAFSIPPAGFMGSAGRNILIGPGSVSLDYSLVKDTALPFLGESGKLEFRAEFFNLLNRVNFARPSTNVYAARTAVESPLDTAGEINGTVTKAREIQLALKLIW